jgi:dTDP-4-dehydrorhamnose reductase
MTKVLVLGARGMLGSMVARVLADNPQLEVTATARGESFDDAGHHRFDAREDELGSLLDGDGYDWVVNAIGVIKPRIDERRADSIENAIAVNALFPYRLAVEAAARGQRVIQIATDCVYSGTRGGYDESAPHDPVDVYGKSKSLGEVPADNVTHLRCSIIGPERGTALSLLEWILSAQEGAELRGFSDHLWNGVTTLQFAKLCEAMIAGTDVRPLQHVVPGDSVNKAELLRTVLSAFGRADVTVIPGPAPQPIDRTLSTLYPRENEALWHAAGYEAPPTITEMLHELAAHEAGVSEQAA